MASLQLPGASKKAAAPKVSMSAPSAANEVPEFHKPELGEVTNKDTGSTFYTIGTTPDGFRLSMRLYMDSEQKPGFTKIALRLRFGDQMDDAPDKLAVPMYVHAQQHYPNAVPLVSASSQKGAHISIEGLLMIPGNPWEKEELLKAIAPSPFAAQLHASLPEVFPGLQMVPLDELRNLTVWSVHRAVADVMVPSFVLAEKVVHYMVGRTEAGPLITSKGQVQQTLAKPAQSDASAAGL